MGNDEFLSYKDKYIGSSKTKGVKGSSKGMASTNRIVPARLDEKKLMRFKKSLKKHLKL